MFTVPLKPPFANPLNDALEAAYVWSKYSRLLLCFAIGDEPDIYPGATYSSYIASFDMFKEAIRAAAPGARYCGPCVGSESSWCVSFAAARAGSLITHHYYPGGNPLMFSEPRLTRVDDVGRGGLEEVVGCLRTAAHFSWRRAKAILSRASWATNPTCLAINFAYNLDTTSLTLVFVVSYAPASAADSP